MTPKVPQLESKPGHLRSHQRRVFRRRQKAGTPRPRRQLVQNFPSECPVVRRPQNRLTAPKQLPSVSVVRHRYKAVQIRRQRYPPESPVRQAVPQPLRLPASPLRPVPYRAADRLRRQPRRCRPRRAHQAPSTPQPPHRLRRRWPTSNGRWPSRRPKLLLSLRLRRRSPLRLRPRVCSRPIFPRSLTRHRHHNPARPHPRPRQSQRPAKPPWHRFPRPALLPLHPYPWVHHPLRPRPLLSRRPPTSAPAFHPARQHPAPAQSAPLRPFRFRPHAPSARPSRPPPFGGPAAILLNSHSGSRQP